MTDLWCPGAIRVPAPRGLWGSYVENYTWRGVLHTTESDQYPVSVQNYFGKSYWPHFTGGQAADGRRALFQHIPLNYSARALVNESGGVETNRAHAVQMEIVWRAANAPNMPDWLLNIVRTAMRYSEEAVGILPIAPVFYGLDAGFTLASPTAKQRMTTAQWNVFSGWCGHQHVPENSHWDPGKIPIDKLLPAPTPAPDPDEEDDMPRYEILIPTDFNGHTHDANGNPLGPQVVVKGNRWTTCTSQEEHDRLVQDGAVVRTADPFIMGITTNQLAEYKPR